MGRYAILFLYLILLLFSCDQLKRSDTHPTTNEIAKEKTVVLSANAFRIEGTTFNDDMTQLLLYKIQNTALELVDTLKVENRKFNFEGLTEELQFYSIKTDASKNNYRFLVDNSIIEIALHNDLKHSSVYSNSTIQKAYNSYAKKIDSFTELKNTAINKYPVFNTTAIKDLKNERFKIYKNKLAYVDGFIQEHTNSKVAALLINDFKDVLDIKKIRTNYNALSPEIKALAYSKTLETSINAIEDKFKTTTQTETVKTTSASRTEYREQAIAISGLNPDGATISLTSIPQGKIILVDFWASWCGPCRTANPDLVRLYNKYKHRGFEILSVSEDLGENEWINAIANDNLVWPYHILDKNKAIAFRYGVESIPFNILIDKRGRIASEKISGSRLEQRIVQLLNE